MTHLVADEGKTYTDGTTYSKDVYLPDGADASAWRQIADADVPDEWPAKYSTLSIKRELAALGKWATVKALLTESGYWDDYVLANYLAANDPVFVTACAAIVSQGILSQTELDALLPKCIWTAD